jgi:hypothetical protein
VLLVVVDGGFVFLFGKTDANGAVDAAAAAAHGFVC